MTALNKLGYFKKNPGGTGPVAPMVQPGANGTWANATSVTAGTQDTGMAAAGYISFDADTSDTDTTQTEYRIPVFRA